MSIFHCALTLYGFINVCLLEIKFFFFLLFQARYIVVIKLSSCGQLIKILGYMCIGHLGPSSH